MKVIVVAKTPKLEVIEASSDRALADLRERDPDALAALIASTRRQRAALSQVVEALEERSPRTQLHRIAITVNGIAFPFPCLNDILVSSPNPAAMSRYVLTAGSRSEIQASSGIWISTPAGSTGGVRSAGGTVMPLEGALIQYAVREPYGPRQGRYELLRGVRHIREGLVVRSRMPEGSLYVDDLMELREGPQLRVLGMHPALRER
jgi:hypothetical protein